MPPYSSAKCLRWPKNSPDKTLGPTRSALENAASITSLILTTEALVADKPEKEKPSAGGHGGSHDFDM